MVLKLFISLSNIAVCFDNFCQNRNTSFFQAYHKKFQNKINRR